RFAQGRRRSRQGRRGQRSLGPPLASFVAESEFEAGGERGELLPSDPPGSMQRQGVHLRNGALVTSGAASTGYALPAGAPPVPCTTEGAWPNEMNPGGVPCYLASYNGQYVDTYGAQDIYPGQSAKLGATYSSGSMEGQVAPAAWQLAWDNLFDYWP